MYLEMKIILKIFMNQKRNSNGTYEIFRTA